MFGLWSPPAPPLPPPPVMVDRADRFGMPPPRPPECDEFTESFFAVRPETIPHAYEAPVEPLDEPVACKLPPAEIEPQESAVIETAVVEPLLAETVADEPPESVPAEPLPLENDAFQMAVAGPSPVEMVADEPCEAIPGEFLPPEPAFAEPLPAETVVHEPPALFEQADWLVELPPIAVRDHRPIRMLAFEEEITATVDPDWDVYPEGVVFKSEFQAEYFADDYGIITGRMTLPDVGPLPARVAERLLHPDDQPLTLWPIQRSPDQLDGRDSVERLRQLFDSAHVHAVAHEQVEQPCF